MKKMFKKNIKKIQKTPKKTEYPSKTSFRIEYSTKILGIPRQKYELVLK